MTNMKESIELNKANKTTIRQTKNKTTTQNVIRINGLPTKEALARCLDQVVMLSKSDLYTKLQDHLNKFMVKYHELPEEEQQRTVHSQYVKDIIARNRQNLKNDAEYYAKYKSDERARPAMLINSEEKGYESVIDTDYFKEVKTDVKIDFPYQSIQEIFKDKNLPTSEKSVMISKLLEIKQNYGIEPKQETEKSIIDMIDDKSDTIDLIKEFSMDDDDNIADEDDMLTNLVGITEKPPKEMFLTLCQKYPKQFINADRGRGKRIGWLKTYRKRTYTPALITVNPYEFEEQKRIYEKDSTTYYLTDGYYIHGLDCVVYFIRTTKEF